MDADGWEDQVGTVAEEAQRLLESLRRAGTPSGGGPGAGHAGAADDHGHPGDGTDEPWTCTDPFCRVCPLCRAVAVLRDLSPETLSRLAGLAGVAASVLADLAGERAGAAAADDAETDTGSRAGRHRPAPGQPIPVRDAEDDAVDDPEGGAPGD